VGPGNALPAPGHDRLMARHLPDVGDAGHTRPWLALAEEATVDIPDGRNLTSFSVSPNGPIRRGFCEVYIGRKRPKNLMCPLFDRMSQFWHSPFKNLRTRKAIALFSSRLHYLLSALCGMAVSIHPYPHMTTLRCQISLKKAYKSTKKAPQKVSENKNDSPS
jgi:hypothetical protein